MIYAPDDFSDDELAEAAKEAFGSRPRESSMWDDRLYSTHAPVMGWAERGDDLLSESNYHAALDMLTGAAGDDADAHVIDATISDWLVGSLRQIFVQARDESGAFTPAWREAVAIAYALREYPVLDESDLSARESEAFDKAFDDALWQARNSYDREAFRVWDEDTAPMPDDITDELHERIVARVHEAYSDGVEFHGDSYADCNYDAVSEEYARHALILTGNDPSVPLVSLTRTTVRGQARMF